MNHKILNTWKSDKTNLEFYVIADSQLIAQSGDYKAFEMPYKSVLYTYKNASVAHCVKYNPESFECIYSGFAHTDRLQNLLSRVNEQKAKAIEIWLVN